eukprot:13197805-Alexandrium_andersonii.AAC.1
MAGGPSQPTPRVPLESTGGARCGSDCKSQLGGHVEGDGEDNEARNEPDEVARPGRRGGAHIAEFQGAPRATRVQSHSRCRGRRMPSANAACCRRRGTVASKQGRQ